jgi:hypothetical protein
MGETKPKGREPAQEPAAKPKATVQDLRAMFVSALLDDFRKHGAEAVRRAKQY